MTRASDTAKLLGAGATILDGTTISTADNTSQLILTSTDADSSFGPILELARDSASPADGDAIGQIKFVADNDAGQATDYGTINGTLRDASDGTEDAQIQYNAMVGGSSADFMRYGVGGDGEIGVIFNEGSIDADFRVESNGNANMFFVDGGNDKVAINNNNPQATLDVTGTFAISNSPTSYWSFDRDDSGGQLKLSDSTTERLRVDGSGNAFIGNTAEFVDGTGDSDIGIQLNPIGMVVAKRSGGVSGIFGRQTSDGDLLQFRRNATAVGSIGTVSNKLHIASTGNSGIRFRDDLNCFIPCNSDGSNSDNDQNIGQSGVRFGTVFATSPSINTSDRNEKQDIEELTDAEKRVAVVAKGLMRKYRWKDAFALKGDKARTHFGIIAQDLQDAFTAESLDASKYAMFCSDTWWEKEITVDAVEADEEKGIEAKDAYTYIDDKQEATEGYTERTRLGVRYSELLAFIISAI